MMSIDKTINFQKSKTEKKALNITSISAKAFHFLNNRSQRKKRVQCFSLTISSIDDKLHRRIKAEEVKNKTKEMKIKALTELTTEQVLEKLSTKFCDLKTTFDKSKVNELSPHHLYDHKIELEQSEAQMSKS